MLHLKERGEIALFWEVREGLRRYNVFPWKCLSRKHTYIILTPLNPLLYCKSGIHYFSYFWIACFRNGLFLLKIIDCGYSLAPPRWGSSIQYPQSMFCGGSNEYTQSMFLSRNMKTYQNFYLKTFCLWWWNFQCVFVMCRGYPMRGSSCSLLKRRQLVKERICCRCTEGFLLQKIRERDDKYIHYENKYSNILKPLLPKNENFLIENSDSFQISAQSID